MMDAALTKRPSVPSAVRRGPVRRRADECQRGDRAGEVHCRNTFVSTAVTKDASDHGHRDGRRVSLGEQATGDGGGDLGEFQTRAGQNVQGKNVLARSDSGKERRKVGGAEPSWRRGPGRQAKSLPRPGRARVTRFACRTFSAVPYVRIAGAEHCCGSLRGRSSGPSLRRRWRIPSRRRGPFVPARRGRRRWIRCRRSQSRPGRSRRRLRAQSPCRRRPGFGTLARKNLPATWNPARLTDQACNLRTGGAGARRRRCDQLAAA